MPTASDSKLTGFSERLLRYTRDVGAYDTPKDVLDALHRITSEECDLLVLGAMVLPRRWGEWQGIEEGRTVFIHDSAPKQWWGQFAEHSSANPGPSLNLAYRELEPFTLTEVLRAMEPKGVDRRGLELTQGLGIRDTLCCPVGRKWLVAYWSRQVLDKVLTPERRALAFLGATYAAIRLEKLIYAGTASGEKGTVLTPRELAVLRLLSNGKRVKEIAEYLELGEETVRSHIKKLLSKLNASTHSHAVAQALRLELIS